MPMAHSLVIFSNPSLLKQPSSLYLPSSLEAQRSKIQRNCLSIRRGMKSSGINGGGPSKRVTTVTNFSSGPVASGGPRLPIPNFPMWARLLLGSIVCLAVPVYKKLSKIEDGIEKATETILDTVEEVAETAEKVVSDIADSLPEDSKLKQSFLKLENLAKEVDKRANKAEEFVRKLDHITDEVDDLVEPIIEEGEKFEKESQEERERKEKETQNKEKDKKTTS